MNKKETVYEALTNVKREYVEEAERFNFKKRRISWQRVLGMAAAACLVVAMAAIAIIPKRERNPWAANAPTNAPTETGAPITTGAPTETGEPPETGAPDYERLAFVGREKLCDIPMVEHISVPSHSQLEGSRAEALGYLGDSAGAVGPVGLTAASDERFILLDQVCKRLFTINRDGNFSTYFLSFCDRPRTIAYLDGADPSLGDPVVSPEDATVVNDDGTQYTILDDSLRSFVGEGLIAVLDSENIRVLRLPDMELICTVSLSEQYYVYDFNYGHDQLRFADGKLYFNANSEKALTVGIAALFENEHIGAEMLEEVPAMPQVRDVTDYTALNTEVPDGMTVSYGWFKRHRVDGWGRSWSVEADLITPIDAYDDLLLAQTAVGSNFENMRLFVGLYSSETDASCSMEIDTENRLLPAQFAMSPSGRVYELEFYEDRAELYELEYEANEAAEPTAEPNPYNKEEYDTLLAFFELADENGVKNGEKCFKDYDPNQINFWGGEDAYSAIWNENGHLEELWFVTGDPDNLMKLVGEFKLDGFAELFRFQSMFVIFESMSITNCPKLCDIARFEATGDISVSGCAPIYNTYLESDAGCRYEGRDVMGHSLLVELTTEGSGSVAFNCRIDEHYFPIYITATPDEGHEFLGWYDADGKLFSTENEIEISDEAIGGCEGEFIYTARFEPMQSVLKTDPWYLEKAWEYAEFVNREYGFNFVKDEAKFNEAEMRITFTHIESEEYINPQEIWIYLDNTEKAVKYVLIFGDGSDRPEEYASMSDEELRALYDTVSLITTYTVTREDMLQAGYTLNGTDEDYVKIAEYCGKLKTAELENAPELHCYRCIEADVYVDEDIAKITDPSLNGGAETVSCLLTLYFRPAYPKLFTRNTADIGFGCNMTPLDDADHPGRIYFWGGVDIVETADGWSCRFAYSVG